MLYSYGHTVVGDGSVLATQLCAASKEPTVLAS